MKFKEITFGKTKTYTIGNNFFVDIVKEKTGELPCFNVWLYHADCEVKYFLYGLPVKTTKSFKEAEKIVKENLVKGDIKDYLKNFMDVEEESQEKA